MMDVNPLTLGIETSGGVMVCFLHAVSAAGAVGLTTRTGEIDPAQHWHSNGRYPLFSFFVALVNVWLTLSQA
jgi:hypothetical protein